MSPSIISSADGSPFPRQRDQRGLNHCTFLMDSNSPNSKSDDGEMARRWETDSQGISSTTSFQTEASLFSHDGAFESGTHVSIDRKDSSFWSEEKENTVKKPYDYVASLGGKAIRRDFLVALNFWLRVDEESCEIIDRAVTMLHNSSLLIDDIQDGSDQRRGSLSAHRIYGIAQTINAANYVYFKAQDELRKLENWPQAFLAFNKELLNLHRGQGMELYWRDTSQPPSEADYLQMIGNKTGGLFRLILQLLRCASTCEYDIEPLVDVIGLMFQILDDYKNLKDDKMSAQKGYCEDLTEGKFSFPISHAIWVNDSSKSEILTVLKSRTTDDALKAYVVQCLGKAGSFDYTKQVLESLYVRAKSLLDAIPQRNFAIEALVEKMMVSIRTSNSTDERGGR
ncbi:hypothetical protein MMC07_001647 [Pseudocyphellaria aurata]|nr:hypothetical protein [Pseudocyphellaria aurata]